MISPETFVPNIAILVANGFDESHITAVQRAMTKAGISYKIVAPEQGLVNGWQGNGWGHYFTVDTSISTAMGSDFDLLILAGGERGVTKLKSIAHARRIVNHFLEAEKPIAAIGAGVELLALSPKSLGLTVSAPGAASEALQAAGLICAEEDMTVSGVIVTSDGQDVDAWTQAVMTLAENCSAPEENEAQAA